MKTLENLLREGTALLHTAEIEEARLDAWLLLEYVTGRNRAYYYAHSDEPADCGAEEKYLELCRRRAAHVPLQHLTHSAWFMGHEFYVDRRVLVPRQDTETLAEKAVEILKEKTEPEILDMCTGSGCILLSILAEYPDARGVGADISREALEVARENAERMSLKNRAVFTESDLFSGDYFQKNSGKKRQEYDMLISNPPYIPTAEIQNLMDEVRLYDPVSALDGKEDGLYFYRRITEEASGFLKNGGWLLYEIGCDQGEAVSKLLQKAGFRGVRVCQDLAGLDRVVLGQKKETENTGGTTCLIN
ncbi:MAG TPA: peptide chain release factor N(5)-glutamine methyltransferase [Candidatus Blautia excrementipullorum]|nr:peptide chain release factor N(5)-glutamine methyltransferase [Candidatus Blautia excrementipullorum]